MKKTVTLHVAKNYYRKLRKARKKMLQQCAPETIHEFRVTYKKLKAFLSMLTPNPKKQVIIPKKLKKIYQLSGTIRDIQLQLARYLEAGKDKAENQYRKTLEENAKPLKQKMHKLFAKKIIAKSKHKGLVVARKSFGDKEYKKYLRSKHDRIRKMALQKYFSDTRLHSIRKEIKELLYNSTYFNDKAYDITEQQKEEYISYKKLSSSLGDFQDLSNAVHLLQPASYPFLDTLKKNWLAHERNDLLNSKAAIKKTLVKDIKTMFP